MQARAYLIWIGLLVALCGTAAAAEPVRPVSSHCYLEPQDKDLSLRCDHAPSLEAPDPTTGFVALATSKPLGFGIAAGSNAKDAQEQAIKFCAYYGNKNCHVVETRANTCLAVVQSAKEKILVWANRDERGRNAGEIAIERCKQAGGSQCLSDAAYCSNSTSEDYISLAITGVHDQGFGWSTSPKQADELALEACRGGNGAKCQIVLQAARTCVGVASSREGVLTAVTDQDPDRAQAAAVQDCRARGGKACEARLADCSDGRSLAKPPSRWASPILLAVNLLLVLLSLFLIAFRLASYRVQARPDRSESELAAAGKAANLPVTFQTSRVRAGAYLAVALLIMVPGTVLAFLYCAMTLTGHGRIEAVPLAAASICGLCLLWITPKLLYQFGRLALHPEQITLSRRGLSIEGMRGRQEWQWRDITQISITATRAGKVLLLSLKDGVPGYNVLQLTSRAKFKAIRLTDFWKTPSRFHTPEFLRDLIEPIWVADKDGRASFDDTARRS